MNIGVVIALIKSLLNPVKSALTSVQNDLTAYKKLDFELGTISITNGQIDKSYSNRVCCAEYIEFDSVLTVTPGNDTKVNLRFYDKNKSFLGGTSSWKTTKQTVADYKSTYPTAKYLRIACAYTDDSTISDPTVFVGKIEVKIKGNLSDLYEKVEKNTDGLSDKSFEYNNIGTLENPNSVTYRNTGYVPVNEGDVVEYRTRIRNGYTYYVFDENKTQILRGEFVALDTEHGFITIPSGGKYIFAQTMHTNHDYYEKYTPILKILGIKSLIEGSQNLKIHNKPTGNVSIVCAKEFTFSDGTSPVNEFYLLEEPLTQQFYITHDFSDKIKAFKFVGEDSYKYTFGVLQNGDIIAVRFAETLTGTGKNDANRMNPFVFLASENWSVQHEVSFGSALKPCGWLSNTGFRVLPNGTAVFCEYTRVTTETSNVWVLSGDPLVASNWTVTKSFPITNPGDGTLFKHCHTIQYDHFTGVVYVATGDDDVGSMIWYSTDNGLTWTQLIPPNGSSEQDEHGWYMGSEKYCRLLMFTFTDDYIYWASDTPLPNRHFLFRAERNNNGVLDFDTVEDYVEIPAVSTLATYGTAYIPELNSIMLLERSDSGATSAPIRLVDLETDELVTVATMYSASGSSDNVGFRTRFSEWYPHNGFIRLGFMLRVSPSKAVNTIKGFGNTGATNDPGNNINNLTLQITKQDGDFKLTMGTIYI